LGSEGIAPPFLTSACHFILGEITSGTHWIGGWMGPKAVLNAMEKRKVLFLPGIEPQPSSLSLYRLSYPSCKNSIVYKFKKIKIICKL
jgi:hypothetical protein